MPDESNENEVRFIFVYGSLRPDDSCMAWTKEANIGMLHSKAVVYDHCMYWDTYASVKSKRPGKQVIGYLLSVDPSSKPVDFANKLKCFDEIEGTSRGLYLRTVTNAIILQTGEKVACFIYVRNDANEAYEVPEGDWLKRDKVFC